MILVDLDLLIHVGLFGCRYEGFFARLRNCDNYVLNIIEYFNRDYRLFLSGDNNFRKEICSTYKGNRKEKPDHFYEVRNYFIKYWEAEVAEGEEADDAIGKAITDNCIIVSNDHDYKQLGVPMFNPRTWQITEVTNPEYWWWIQMLTGCKTDNVLGVPNPAKAHHKTIPNFTEDSAGKLLEGKTKEEMKDIVQGLYREIYGDAWFTEYDLRARLLFLRRKDADEYWKKY